MSQRGPPPGPWQSSLLGCCASPLRALFGLCCPCILTFQLVERSAPFEVPLVGIVLQKEAALPFTLLFYLIGGGTAGTCLFVFSVMMFVGIRNKFNINEGTLITVFKAICCLCCYQIQIIRHMDEVEGLVGNPVAVHG
ncbi:unnamed protein product [Effrenium voratum]|nr:unnamed protein product [Effrenium voratum]